MLEQSKSPSTLLLLSQNNKKEYLTILGARENNLKNINVQFQRNQLIVITGISGSGKSSLAFDTIYAEGQRRYMETFGSYARTLMGAMKRPEVDKISGLSPVIAIEQKTTSQNARSTVGTTTEIYDFLRLLFARTAEAYSYISGERMIQQTDEQVQDLLLQVFEGQKIILFAPLIKGRRGYYKELFEQMYRMGFSQVRIDGKITGIMPEMQLDRYKMHDIDLLVDELVIQKDDLNRLRNSLYTAWNRGKGNILVQDSKGKLHYFSKELMDPSTGLSYRLPEPNTFSFNSKYGACETCHGLGEIIDINIDALMPNKHLSIQEGAIPLLGPYRKILIFKKIEAILNDRGFSIKTPVSNLPDDLIEELLNGSDLVIPVPSTRYPGTFWNTKFDGIIPFLMSLQPSPSITQVVAAEVATTHTKICKICQGARLKKEPLHFRIANKNISEVAMMDIKTLIQWINDLQNHFNQRQLHIAGEMIKELKKRAQFLLNVGLHYLSLNRPVKTLSGGETQRIRLATQLGSELTGVLYILDEPSIGLHKRDNKKLINSLKELRDLGNTVVVVEHDEEMMRSADYILDIGPGAGKLGGQVINQGTLKKFLKENSPTAAYLRGDLKISKPEKRREGTGKSIVITGCKGNNLRSVDLVVPLGKLICITGVSGSGKSSLIHNTLVPILKQKIYNSFVCPFLYNSVEGWENIDRVIEVDQSPIGRTPRSSPATYTGVLTDIRYIFAELPESKVRGYTPGRFSFNVKSGRCMTCEGGGKKMIKMDFLPVVYVTCESCAGKRYQRETLEVRYRCKSISNVLEMTIEEAVNFFKNYPKITRKLQILVDVGLGYITLGQHATTISGGEAQRVKLATELYKRDTGKTIYILDEPTTGLHFQDIQLLFGVLQKLVDKGNTILIVEHNMDVIRVADHIIDMGPDGGSRGGTIVAQGTPEEIVKCKKSYTAKYL